MGKSSENENMEITKKEPALMIKDTWIKCMYVVRVVLVQCITIADDAHYN